MVIFCLQHIYYRLDILISYLSFANCTVSKILVNIYNYKIVTVIFIVKIVRACKINFLSTNANGDPTIGFFRES